MVETTVIEFSISFGFPFFDLNITFLTNATLQISSQVQPLILLLVIKRIFPRPPLFSRHRYANIGKLDSIFWFTFPVEIIHYPDIGSFLDH